MHFYVYESHKNEIWILNPSDNYQKCIFNMSYGYTSHMFHKKTSVSVRGCNHDERHDKIYEKKLRINYKNVVGTPCFDPQNNLVIGMIECVNKKEQSFFNKNDLAILQIFSSYGVYLIKQKLDSS